MTETRRLVEPQCHEFDGNLNYNADGLRPYFGFARAVSDGGGAVETTFSDDSDTWKVTLRYTEGNLVRPSGGVTPGGSEFNVGTTDGNVREFRLDVAAVDDDLRSASFHVRPRWHGLEGEKSDGTVVPIPVPDSLVAEGDALSIRAQGSNLPFEDYPRLLRRAARAVGVTGSLRPENVHPTSNIVDAARYVRIDRDRSGPVHSRSGPIQTLAHVLEGDREGYRKLVQNDETNHGENLPGFYHTCTLGPERVREVMPSHDEPVEIKHYYAREALDRPRDDPLAHPKLEVSLQSSRGGTVPFEDVGRLTRELDDWIYSVVQESLGEASLRAGYGGYVSDGVWSPTNGKTEAGPVKLDLTEVRHEQQSIVYQHVADGMAPTDYEVLQTLVTDGGRVSPSDVAKQTGRHQDTVYRALQRMNDLVDHSYGEIQLQSTYISELVADALEEAKSAVARATSAAAQAEHASSRDGIDEQTSAFLAWAERYTEMFDERSNEDGGVRLDLGRVDSVRDVRRRLRRGLDLWESMNRDAALYRMGSVQWRFEGEEGLRHGTIWKMLRGTGSGGTRVVGTAPTTDF